MPHEALTIVLVCLGVSAAAARLWFIWWRSDCGCCGLEHSLCVCPSGDHLMRPRR